MSETTTKQETKFYHVENCNRHLHSAGLRFTFEPYEQIGGCWFGVLSTSDPDEIAALDKLCGDKKSSVTLIDAVEFTKAQKKKSLAPPNFGPSKPASARSFTGDASDVVSLSGNSVNPDLNVPDVPATAPASPDAAGSNIGQLTPPQAPKASGRKAK